MDHSALFEAPQLSASKVRINKLTLWSFRNYGHQRLVFEEPFILLAGMNGAGKTNVLEAISYLAPGKGLRRSPLSQIGRVCPSIKPQPWAVTVSLNCSGLETILSSGLDPQLFYAQQEKRVGRIDGDSVKNLADFESYLSLFWLTPDTDRLFKESPGIRRKFLDKLLLRYEPSLSSHWQKYDNAMRQRISLLKYGRGDAIWLNQLEKQMVESGMVMLHERLRYTNLLSQTSNLYFEAFPKIEFHLKGELEQLLEVSHLTDVEAFFTQKLCENRGQDAEQGTTTIGPHTTNFQALYTPKGLYAEQCSTGEVKVLLIALILTAVRLEIWQRGKTPVLLLDEIMVHLDADRRAALGNELISLGVQTFMTGTDMEVFAPLFSHAARFCVKEGSVEKIV